MSAGSSFDYEAWDVDNVNLSFVTVEDLRQLLAVRHPNFMSNIYRESVRLDAKLMQDLKSVSTSKESESIESTTISTVSTIISSITPSSVYPTPTLTNSSKTSSTISSIISSVIPSLSTSSIFPSTFLSRSDESLDNSSWALDKSPTSHNATSASASNDHPVTLSLGIFQIPTQHLPIYIGALTGILVLVFLIILFIVITLKKSSRKNISRGKLRSYHLRNENDSSRCDDNSRFIVNINQSQNKRLETVIQLNGNPENSNSVRHELVTPQILSPKFSPILSGFDDRHQMAQEILAPTSPNYSPPLGGVAGVAGYIGHLESFSKPSDNSQDNFSLPSNGQDNFCLPATNEPDHFSVSSLCPQNNQNDLSGEPTSQTYFSISPNNPGDPSLVSNTRTFTTFQPDRQITERIKKGSQETPENINKEDEQTTPNANKDVETTEHTIGTPADWDEGIESEDDIDADAFKKKILAHVVERGVGNNSLVSSLVQKEDLYAKINYEAKYRERGVVSGETSSPVNSMGSDGNSPIVTPPARGNNNNNNNKAVDSPLQQLDHTKILLYGTFKATSFDGSESECLI